MASTFVGIVWTLGLVIIAANSFAEQNLSPPFAGDSVAVLGGQDCADGVVKDDGTLETGYGWVPSVVDGWYIDDRADEWSSVLDSNDPIFIGHRAMMIRAKALEGYFPMVPTLGTWGLLILIGLICAVGALALRRGPRDG